MVEAIIAGQSLYNKCSGLVDLNNLKDPLAEAKQMQEQLKVLDIEALLVVAFSEKGNPQSLNMFKAQLSEVEPGSDREKLIPKVLLAQARQIVADAQNAEEKQGKEPKHKKK